MIMTLPESTPGDSTSHRKVTIDSRLKDLFANAQGMRTKFADGGIVGNHGLDGHAAFTPTTDNCWKPLGFETLLELTQAVEAAGGTVHLANRTNQFKGFDIPGYFIT
ncbi:hypothetical protein A2W24_04485 [Microgenomates group bacterium RBG_16_45_19]|nr:MAG: hypothetical protein A2W24_04485 [Microgenomates group bacterium RBG_16_45_19]